MDITANYTAIRSVPEPVSASVPVPEDDLAFFSALWFWTPAALGIWSALIWAITRVL